MGHDPLQWERASTTARGVRRAGGRGGWAGAGVPPSPCRRTRFPLLQPRSFKGAYSAARRIAGAVRQDELYEVRRAERRSPREPALQKELPAPPAAAGRPFPGREVMQQLQGGASLRAAGCQAAAATTGPALLAGTSCCGSPPGGGRPLGTATSRTLRDSAPKRATSASGRAPARARAAAGPARGSCDLAWRAHPRPRALAEPGSPMGRPAEAESGGSVDMLANNRGSWVTYKIDTLLARSGNQVRLPHAPPPPLHHHHPHGQPGTRRAREPQSDRGRTTGADLSAAVVRVCARRRDGRRVLEGHYRLQQDGALQIARLAIPRPPARPAACLTTLPAARPRARWRTSPSPWLVSASFLRELPPAPGSRACPLASTP